MKFYTFYRESNNFDDILKDANLRKMIREIITWKNHLVLGLSDNIGAQILSYITLKYGDDIRNGIVKDYSPIPNVDYIPKRKQHD